MTISFFCIIVLQPPIQNLRMDDRVPTHQPSTGAPIPSSGSIPMGQHVPRMGGIQQQQTQQPYQQRIPRPGGPIQRGKIRTIFISREKLISKDFFLHYLYRDN